LKKLILAILLYTAFWGVASGVITYNDGKVHINNIDAELALQDLNWLSSKFKCDERKYCSQMGSYDETKFFLKHCPNTQLDPDNDGIPCQRGEW